MRWGLKEDRQLLLYTLGKEVSSKEYSAIADSFTEKPTVKAIQERLTKLRAEQMQQIYKAGILENPSTRIHAADEGDDDQEQIQGDDEEGEGQEEVWETGEGTVSSKALGNGVLGAGLGGCGSAASFGRLTIPDAHYNGSKLSGKAKPRRNLIGNGSSYTPFGFSETTHTRGLDCDNSAHDPYGVLGPLKPPRGGRSSTISLATAEKIPRKRRNYSAETLAIRKASSRAPDATMSSQQPNRKRQRTSAPQPGNGDPAEAIDPSVTRMSFASLFDPNTSSQTTDELMIDEQNVRFQKAAKEYAKQKELEAMEAEKEFEDE